MTMMKRISQLLLLAHLLLLLVVTTVSAQGGGSGIVYYVAPNTGEKVDAKNNINKGYGTSREKPFKTLEYAAKQAKPGDELVLLAGTYVNEGYQDGDIWKTGHTFWIKGLTGEPDNPITIRGEIAPETGERMTILRGDATSIFQCRSCSYVTIRDLHLVGEVENIPLEEAFDNRFLYRLENDETNTDYQRLDPNWTPEEIDSWFDANNTLELLETYRPTKYNTVGMLIHSSWHIIVENCRIGFVPGTGLRAQNGDYITFRNNIVHDCSRRGSTGTNGIVCNTAKNSISGSYIEDNGYRFVMWGNLIYNNYNEVYSWVDTKTYVHPYIDEGKGMSMEHLNSNDWITGRTLMANNVAYNNGLSGVNSNDSDRIDMFHNTVYQNTKSGLGVNTGVSCNDSKDCQIKNNIAISINDWNGRAINSRYGTDITTIDVAGNQYVGTINTNKMPQGTGTKIDTVEEFAFVNLEEYNFRLLEGSVAINACPTSVLTNLNLPAMENSNLDFDGKLRGDGVADCGAFEFGINKGGAGGLSLDNNNNNHDGSATMIFESDPSKWMLSGGTTATTRKGQLEWLLLISLLMATTCLLY